MFDMAVKEMDFEESLEFARQHGTKLVWIGREPIDYMRGLLELGEEELIGIDPKSLVEGDKKTAMAFTDHVFVCYHGNTSRYVADAIKEKFGVESISMKGGVTAVVGEIFG